MIMMNSKAIAILNSSETLVKCFIALRSVLHISIDFGVERINMNAKTFQAITE